MGKGSEDRPRLMRSIPSSTIPSCVENHRVWALTPQAPPGFTYYPSFSWFPHILLILLYCRQCLKVSQTFYSTRWRPEELVMSLMYVLGILCFCTWRQGAHTTKGSLFFPFCATQVSRLKLTASPCCDRLAPRVRLLHTDL